MVRYLLELFRLWFRYLKWVFDDGLGIVRMMEKLFLLVDLNDGVKVLNIKDLDLCWVFW